MVLMAAHFQQSVEDGFPVLTVVGRIGTGDVASFEAHLLELRGRAEDCAVLDLNACPYLTSRAFPLILHASKDLRVRGHDLFVSVSQEIQELLEVLRLESRLSLAPDRQEAIRTARMHRGLSRS